MHYRAEDNSFELRSLITDLVFGKGLPFKVRQLSSNYRVTRQGTLLAISIDVTLEFALDILVTANIHGEVNDGRFGPTIQIGSPWGKRKSMSSLCRCRLKAPS